MTTTIQTRKKILYYCLSLVGVGHLTASLQIIRELLQHSDVDLIYGGLELDIQLEHDGFRALRLSSILIREDSGELYDAAGQRSLEEMWRVRAEEMGNFLRPPYHGVIVEFFPFGRRRFKGEILDLFGVVKRASGAVPIFTCVREVLVPEQPEAERRMAQFVLDHIHTVFVRGDPSVIRLEETFSQVHLIADRLRYVGYLSAPQPRPNALRKTQILVSQGGGNVGRVLPEAAIGVAPTMPGYDFVIAVGSRTSQAEIDALRRTVISDNVRIEAFLQDFPRHLAQSALSISMGGDNTLLDVISTRTPALAFPFPGNTEQTVRITALARKGLVHPVFEGDLTSERLKTKIEQALSTPYPEVDIQMNGALYMSEHVKAIIQGRDLSGART